MTKFAAIGIDHGHVFDHINGLVEAGAEFVGYDPLSTTPDLIELIAETYPSIPQIDAETLLKDKSIEVISVSAVPHKRTDLAIRAMRAGKDVMLDKPGVTTFEQLERARAAVKETGRMFSICFTERHTVRAAVKAGHLVQEGRIGKVVQTLGIGPHRLATMNKRPDWFWDMEAIGGIINDIASHQVDQFLYYTGSSKGEVVTAQVGCFGTGEHPDFQDFGDFILRSDNATGYVRVDWFTPKGLPCWGDGRLTILGTKGYIELRKYVDIAGREGADHLFIVDDNGMEHMDCSDVPLEYFRNFLNDVRDRTETAMSQAHIFEVCRLSLEAQANATRVNGVK